MEASKAGGTLSTTWLVHEAYLKLVDRSRVTFNNEQVASHDQPEVVLDLNEVLDRMLLRRALVA